MAIGGTTASAGILAHLCSERLASAGVLHVQLTGVLHLSSQRTSTAPTNSTQSNKKNKIAGNGTFPGITACVNAADVLDP